MPVNRCIVQRPLRVRLFSCCRTICTLLPKNATPRSVSSTACGFQCRQHASLGLAGNTRNASYLHHCRHRVERIAHDKSDLRVVNRI